jgi:hypothetical protein
MNELFLISHFSFSDFATKSGNQDWIGIVGGFLSKWSHDLTDLGFQGKNILKEMSEEKVRRNGYLELKEIK